MHFLAYVLVPEEKECQSSQDPERLIAKILCKDLVPEGSEEIGAVVWDLLEPFCEHLEVDPYEDVCECVTHGAFMQAAGLADEKFGPLPERRIMIRKTSTVTEDEYPFKERHEFLYKRYDELLPTATADPECDECNGKGKRIVTYNPNSKWDWWVVGEGFSNGILNPAIKKSCGISFTNNEMVPVKCLDCDKLEIPFAVVTPDGQWLDEDQRITKEGEEDVGWDAKVRTILAQHEDCILVAVNFHR
jgi:hypothetical protein